MSDGNRWIGLLGNLVKILDIVPRNVKDAAGVAITAAAIALMRWLVGLHSSIDPFYLWIGSAAFVLFAVWVLVGLRVMSSRKAAGTTRREDASLRIIGNAQDGRSYGMVQDRVIEFDGVAAAYFRGLSDVEISTLTRRITATERYLFSEWDLRHLLGGGTISEARPFIDVHRRYFENRWVAKFWSRQEFDSLSESDRERHMKPDVALRAWAEGTALPLVHNIQTEWLSQGAQIMADHLRHQHKDHPRSPEIDALCPFPNPQYKLAAISNWIAQALEFMKKWPQQEGRPLTR